MLVGTVNQNASLLGVQLQRITQYILLLQELDEQKIVNIVMDLPLTLYLTTLPANKTLLKIPHREHLSIQIRYNSSIYATNGQDFFSLYIRTYLVNFPGRNNEST